MVRICCDRLAGAGDHTIADEMGGVAVKGLHRIQVRDNDGEPDEAVLEINIADSSSTADRKAGALCGADAHCDPFRETRNAQEQKEDRLEADHRPAVQSRKNAIEKLERYSLRWKIEMFHKVFKSGCRAEEAKLSTAQRLATLIGVYCIVSWRVFWMTMLNRSSPGAAPALALTDAEIAMLDRLVKDRHRMRTPTTQQVRLLAPCENVAAGQNAHCCKCGPATRKRFHNSFAPATAAPERVRTPKLRKIVARCTLTVPWLSLSVRAISLFDLPWTKRARTSR